MDRRQDDDGFTGGDGQCPCDRGNPLDLVCLDHRAICCDLCMSEDHPNCLNIRTLTDVAEERRDKLNKMKLTRKMETLSGQMDGLIKEKRNSIAKLDGQTEKITQDIDDMIEQTIRHLRRLQNRLKDKAKSLHTVECGKLRQHVTLIQDFIKNIIKQKEDLDDVLRNGTPLQIFLGSEKAQRSLLKQYQQLKAQLMRDSEIDFVLTTTVIYRDMNELGKIESLVKMPKHVAEILLSVDAFMENMSVQTLPSKPGSQAQIPVTGPRTVNVLTDRPYLLKAVTGGDTGKPEIYLSGGAFIPTGGLLMADYGNQRLLRFDDDFLFQQAYELDGRPSSFVFGSNTEIYVVVNDFFVYICSLIDDALTVSNKLKVGKEAWGIALDQDILIVGCTHELVYMNKVGTTLTKLEKTKCHATDIAFSPRSQTVFYKAANDLVSRKRDGTVGYRHRFGPETYLSGICLDSNNHIYLCDRDTGKVHQIPKTGKGHRVLLQRLESIKSPMAIIFHPAKEMFVVTSCYEKTAFEVYHFK